MSESTVDVLRDLASRDPDIRANAAVSLLFEHDPSSDDGMSDDGRWVELFEDAWRNFDGDRDVTVRELVCTMADRWTRLDEMNYIAYAIAAAGEDGVTELLALLNHHDFTVRGYAALGLGALDNRARWAVPALCRSLERAARGWPSWVILRALGNIGGAEAIAVLQAVGAVTRSAIPTDESMLEVVEGALATALTQS